MRDRNARPDRAETEGHGGGDKGIFHDAGLYLGHFRFYRLFIMARPRESIGAKHRSDFRHHREKQNHTLGDLGSEFFA